MEPTPPTSSRGPLEREVNAFIRKLNDALRTAYPEKESRSAILLEIAYQTGLSSDNLRKVLDAKIFPTRSTIQEILAPERFPPATRAGLLAEHEAIRLQLHRIRYAKRK